MRCAVALGSAVAAAASMLPAVALACPQCAGRPGGSVWAGVAVGAFVFFPYAIVATVIRILRSHARVVATGPHAAALHAPDASQETS